MRRISPPLFLVVVVAMGALSGCFMQQQKIDSEEQRAADAPVTAADTISKVLAAEATPISQGVGQNCENHREVAIYQHDVKHSLKHSIQGKSCMSSVYTVEITNSTGQILYSFSRNLAEMYVSHATTDTDRSVEALKEAKILIHGVSLIPIVDAISPIEEEGQDLRIDAAQAERLTQSNDWAIGHPESFEGHNFIAYDPELSRYIVVSLIGS